MVAVMEEARAIGELAKSGWKSEAHADLRGAGTPKSRDCSARPNGWRRIIAELREHAVVYINSDSNGRGFLDAGGSHTLGAFVNQVARDVDDPQRHVVSVLERARARMIVNAESGGRSKRGARRAPDLRIDALGSGSDYTPFLQHLGIASLNIGYGGEGEYGVYHSVYDSIDHYIRFGDPELRLRHHAGEDRRPHDAAARERGRAAVRSVDAGRNGRALPRKRSTKLAKKMREESEEKNRQLRDRTMELAADPLKPFVAPKEDDAVPHLELAPLQNAVARLQKSARAFDASDVRNDRTVMRARARRSAATKACRGGRGTSITSTRPASTPATA